MYLLETCGENALHFFDAIRDILADFDMKLGLPRQYPRDFPEVFQSISAYRNAMLHNPCAWPGRTARIGIPPREGFVEKSAGTRVLMERCGRIGRFGIYGGAEPVCGYARKAVQYFNRRWREIIALLNSKRSTEKFISVFRAAGITEFAATPAVLFNSIPGSLRYEPRSGKARTRADWYKVTELATAFPFDCAFESGAMLL